EERPLRPRPQRQYLLDRHAAGSRPDAAAGRTGARALLPPGRPAAAAAHGRDPARRVFRRDVEIRPPLHRSLRSRSRAHLAVRAPPPLAGTDLMPPSLAEAVRLARQED